LRARLDRFKNAVLPSRERVAPAFSSGYFTHELGTFLSGDDFAAPARISPANFFSLSPKRGR
jgi:hypothetical protein